MDIPPFNESDAEITPRIVTHLLLYPAETPADEHLEQTCDHNPTK